VKSNWTILSALAERPDGRASLDDIEALSPAVDRPEIASVLDRFDIFQSGMVIYEGEALQITDEGRSALKALEIASSQPLFASPVPSSPVSLGMIDDLIGAEERQKIFGLDLRRNETDPASGTEEVEDVAPTPAPPVVAARSETEPPRPERTKAVRSPERDDVYRHSREAIAIAPRPSRAETAPVVVVRDGISSGTNANDSAPPKRFSAFAARIQQVVGIWRRHLEVENVAPTPALPVVAAKSVPEPPRPERTLPVRPRETNDADWHNREAIATAPRPVGVGTAPVVVVRDGSNSGAEARDSASPKRLSAFATRVLRQAVGIWRRHLERDEPSLIPEKRTRTSGGVAALLTLLVLIICAGSVVAIARIKSLESEVAALQREVVPLRERVARAEYLERVKQNAEQQKEAQNKTGPPARADQIALSLTPEEIRLIRDFIKPAPAGGTLAPAINVGDAVSFATIPLPSTLMEKIPKLLGARFTTRNGSIIILKRDSRQADIVLPPN